ncbi:MAG: pyruvate ferredoxin oxidoreductase [Prevotella sp.]|nr:pyruvate ferredoxin oxidoreductase [Prevotella sp.]MBQ9178601.1 pyruvate ferredoxin oxidoreductase [Prevotella sp.]MBQ9670206.1 pyruvate ferredoxin oxidoreductase [Prevotella sp.]MBR1526293.1 pyruvate ferredoxin oxidoreductase [Prevotella sp.]MDY6230595.1 pyruvate ferredoxin oxidoreductase [Prevotella sp.]
MDYKYIEQLLERYWQCETTLEEEEILRTFFSQKDVPAMLLPYKDLFTYEHSERHEDKLGDDFDKRLKNIIGETAPVKARTLRLTQRLRPLFKAAAIVAIILTLGNALQATFDNEDKAMQNGMANDINNIKEGASMAQGDTIIIDTLKHIQPTVQLIK